MKNIYRVIVGIIQGIFERLPVSSSGMIVLTLTYLHVDPVEALRSAFFLHLGTALAAIIYFRRELLEATEEFLSLKLDDYRKAVMLSVLVSAAVALIVLHYLYYNLERYGSALVGSMLIITGIMLELTRSGNKKISYEAALLAGIAQGFAVIPGISRSGSTLFALGILGVDGEEALRFSFIISIPVVIAAAIFLGYQGISTGVLIGFLLAFIFGYLTIDALLKLVNRIRRGPLLILLGSLAVGFYVLAKRAIFTFL